MKDRPRFPLDGLNIIRLEDGSFYKVYNLR